MVIVLRHIVDRWRERLEELEVQACATGLDSWRRRAELRLLRYLLRRHADGPHADQPRQAEILDGEDRRRSSALRVDPVVAERLGLITNNSSAKGKHTIADRKPDQPNFELIAGRTGPVPLKGEDYVPKYKRADFILLYLFWGLLVFLLTAILCAAHFNH